MQMEACRCELVEQLGLQQMNLHAVLRERIAALQVQVLYGFAAVRIALDAAPGQQPDRRLRLLAEAVPGIAADCDYCAAD